MDSLELSIVAGVFVGLSSGYIGSLMISKRMALVGDALSHVALPGLALGIIFSFNPFIGAFVALFLASVTTWYIERVTRLPTESIVGVLFVFALAVGILLTPEPDLLEALFGDISRITTLETVATAVISVCVLLATRHIYGRVVLSMLSEELAVSKGLNVSRTNLVYLLLVAIVVATGIRVAGSLLVGAMVIVPAVAAKTVSSSLSRYSVLSGIFGMVSAVAGIILSVYAKELPGPMIVLAGTAIFLIGVVVGRKQR